MYVRSIFNILFCSFLIVIKYKVTFFVDFCSHNDFPMVLRMLLQNDLTGFNFNSNLSAIDMFANSGLDHTDLPRMREGRLQGQVPLPIN